MSLDTNYLPFIITGYIQKIYRFVADECFYKWKLVLVLCLKH